MDAVRVDPARILSAAGELAAAGVPVFPCVPGAKRPLTPHGLLDATTDAEQIERWWRRSPTANLAVPTGAGSVDVLDVDHRPAGSGFPSFRALADAGLLAGHTQVVATPSGGIHVYFAGTDQPSARLPELYLDFKAAGGYVLVPPSVVDGRPYVVVRHRPEPAAVLRWADVRALLAPPDSARSTVRRRPGDGPPLSQRHPVDVLAAWVATLPEGRRNNGTFWAACRAAEDGFTDLRPIVQAAITAGLPELEAHRTVASAVRRVTQTNQPPRPTTQTQTQTPQQALHPQARGRR